MLTEIGRVGTVNEMLKQNFSHCEAKIQHSATHAQVKKHLSTTEQSECPDLNPGIEKQLSQLEQL